MIISDIQKDFKKYCATRQSIRDKNYAKQSWFNKLFISKKVNIEFIEEIAFMEGYNAAVARTNVNLNKTLNKIRAGTKDD